jgi:undecaprenyl-diphosphatase
MLDQILALDATITSRIALIFPHNAFFDTFFSFLSFTWLIVIVWMISVIAVFFVQKNRDKRFIIYFIISFLVTSFLVNILLKNVFDRPRPWVAQRLDTKICPKDFSFPSGHASGAFAGAAIMAAYDKKRRYVYYGLAFLISLSRIYLVCHYFLDVSFGALIGYSISKLVLYERSYSLKKRDDVKT